MMAKVKKPLPIPDGDSKTYWEGCSEGKLLIQHCLDCEKHIFYPRAVCPHCMSDCLEWIESSGKGKVYSYTISRRGAGSAFADDAPYVVALIDLDEGVRMMSNIIHINVEDVRCDMPVEVVFQDQEGMEIPKFQPA
jgi:uncharacterized OB-fold protein